MSCANVMAITTNSFILTAIWGGLQTKKAHGVAVLTNYVCGSCSNKLCLHTKLICKYHTHLTSVTSNWIFLVSHQDSKSKRTYNVSAWSISLNIYTFFLANGLLNQGKETKFIQYLFQYNIPFFGKFFPIRCHKHFYYFPAGSHGCNRKAWENVKCSTTNRFYITLRSVRCSVTIYF